MVKTATELEKAHEELDKAVETQEKSRLAKSLDALRARFGFGQVTEEDTGELTKANSSPMPENSGNYPQNAVNEGNISRARAKSKPAKHPDGNYEGLEEGENDTTTYENFEPDALNGSKGRRVTDKKSLKGVDEESFYKAIIDGDESGEVVEAINASDALELLANSMGKSIAEVSKQSEAIGRLTQEQFDDLNKSLAVLAEAVGTIMETLEKGGTTPPAVPPVTQASADIKSEETRTTGEESTEEVEKSLSPDQKKYKKTLEFLAEADRMNAPSYFSQITGEALQKSKGKADDNTPESLNTLAGRQRVKRAINELMKSDGLDADFLGALDFRPVSDVVARLPKELRSKAGLD